jgi:pSer/pThr/pTyr-binding forkhead associated (FHA) protein
MTQENGEVLVRDLGSTNGIRINGQRVEIGRLKAGDELSIAHIRYRLENGQAHEQTIAEPVGAVLGRSDAMERGGSGHGRPAEPPAPASFENQGENAFAAAVRKLLPSGVADKCRIQVIVQMAGDEAAKEQPAAPNSNPGAENEAECRSDSRH